MFYYSIHVVYFLVAYIAIGIGFIFLLTRYGYAVASALHGVQHILRKDFMLQVYMRSVIIFLNFTISSN